MKFLIGKKIGMTRIFAEDGLATPVTIIQSGVCTVVSVKKKPHDTVDAVQVGFGITKKMNKPQQGQLRDLPQVAFIYEFRTDMNDTFERGSMWSVDVFTPKEKVKITGTSKGHGFQGVVKRHGFHGHPASHGHKDQLRMPGSIGSKRQGPVQKGKRMAGRMGNDRITVQNAEVICVDKEKQLVYIKGPLPGAYGSVVTLVSNGMMQMTKYAPDALSDRQPMQEVHTEIASA